ncbi:MAG: hypothetical protein ABWY27_18030 [Telluria sp.]
MADLDNFLRAGGAGKRHCDGYWDELRCELHVAFSKGIDEDNSARDADIVIFA